MTDQEYKDAKKRFETIAQKWHPLMQMGWYTIKYEYLRDYFDDDVNTVATCSPSWIYRKAHITVSMRKVHDLDDEELENCIIHEFAHVVLAPVTQDQPEEWHEQVEFVTETIAILFQNIANGGGQLSHEIVKESKDRKAS